MKMRKGFTLVEVIIAVAAMAVLGGFIMQLFVLSRQVGESATNTDEALERAVAIISDFKQAESPGAFWTTVSDEGYSDGENTAVFYYDRDWNPSNSDDAAMIVNISLARAADEQAKGCQDLHVWVIDATDSGQLEELINIRTSRYFGIGEGVEPS